MFPFWEQPSGLQGALGSWLKVVGVREAQRMRKAAPVKSNLSISLTALEPK